MQIKIRNLFALNKLNTFFVWKETRVSNADFDLNLKLASASALLGIQREREKHVPTIPDKT